MSNGSGTLDPARSDDERKYYELNATAWPRFAPFYDCVTAPLRNLRARVVTLAGAGATSSVLDLATGTGAQALAFARRAGTVVGVDLCDAMLRIAIRKRHAHNLAYRQADAAALPFRDGVFDVSCISFALHEMPRSIRDRTLSEMLRVTLSNGTIVIVDYAPPRTAFERAIARVVRRYEGPRYADFIGSDVHHALRARDVDVRTEERFLRGAVWVLVGVRT